MAIRRLVPAAEFQAAFDALESPNARWMAEELASLLLARPNCVPPIAGRAFRALHTNAYDAFPPLTLVYQFDDDAVYLLDVEVYDPLLPEET